MFVCEAALGREYTLTRDDPSLLAPPSGYDSVVAKGTQEPNPQDDITLSLDGRSVVVPQGKPRPEPQFGGSSFSNSEFLVYKESQNKIRYMVTIKM